SQRPAEAGQAAGQRPRVGHPGRLDDDPVGCDVDAEFLEGDLEVHGVELAADAARAELDHPLCKAEPAHDEAVDADLAELVDDDRHALPRPLLEEPAQQRRLAAAEVPADDVDGNGGGAGSARHPSTSSGSPSRSEASPPRWWSTDAPTSSRRQR